MRRRYIITVFLLLGLGIISTLAFTFNSAIGVVPNPVLIESEADNDITRIIVLPGDGNDDGARDENAIRFLIKTSESRDNLDDYLVCTFIFLDSSYDPVNLASATAEYKVTGTGTWTSVASPTLNADLGEITFSITPTSGNTALIWIEIELTSLYTNTEILQASVDVVEN